MTDDTSAGPQKAFAARLLVEASKAERATRDRSEVALRELRSDPALRLTDRQRATLQRLIGSLQDALHSDIGGRLGSILGINDVGPVTSLDDDPDLISSILRAVDLDQLEKGLRLAAQRDGLAADVIDQFIEDGDSELADASMALVALESQRRDRFGEMLLPLADLPAPLRSRLVWRVADAMGRFVRADEEKAFLVPTAIAESAMSALTDAGSGIWSATSTLAENLIMIGRLGDKAVLDILTEGRVALFITALALRTDSDEHRIGDMVIDADVSRLTLLLRAARFEAPYAAAILARLYTALDRTTPDDDARLAECIAGFSAVSEEVAAVMLGIRMRLK